MLPPELLLYLLFDKGVQNGVVEASSLDLDVLIAALRKRPQFWGKFAQRFRR